MNTPITREDCEYLEDMQCIAAEHASKKKLLEYLANTGVPYIRNTVAKNPHLDKYQFDRLYESAMEEEDNYLMRGLLANTEHATAEFLMSAIPVNIASGCLASTDLGKVPENPNANKEVLSLLVGQMATSVYTSLSCKDDVFCAIVKAVQGEEGADIIDRVYTAIKTSAKEDVDEWREFERTLRGIVDNEVTSYGTIKNIIFSSPMGVAYLTSNRHPTILRCACKHPKMKRDDFEKVVETVIGGEVDEGSRDMLGDWLRGSRLTENELLAKKAIKKIPNGYYLEEFIDSPNSTENLIDFWVKHAWKTGVREDTVKKIATSHGTPLWTLIWMAENGTPKGTNNDEYKESYEKNILPLIESRVANG